MWRFFYTTFLKPERSQYMGYVAPLIYLSPIFVIFGLIAMAVKKAPQGLTVTFVLIEIAILIYGFGFCKGWDILGAAVIHAFYSIVLLIMGLVYVSRGNKTNKSREEYIKKNLEKSPNLKPIKE